MQLKERSLDKLPQYVNSAKKDFETLALKQKEYDENFGNHRIWPASKFHEEKKRIEEEWKTRSPNAAGQSLAMDIERLTLAYKQIESNITLQTVIINSLFGALYNCFPGMYNDWSVGYLLDGDYENYLIQYQEAIDTNKRLKLDCWDKPALIQIQKEISAILK